VDPIGTGYSRATSDKFRDILYTTQGDAEAVAEGIRMYRTRFNAWDAPLFIAGESYGTFRAMAVAQALERRRIHLTGVILMSGSYAGAQLPSALTTALLTPMLTVTAYFHKRLPEELQSLTREEAVARSNEWALREYAPALERVDRLTDAERTAVLDRLGFFIGMNPRWVDFKRLSIDKDEYLDELLADRNLELGRYDSRMTAPHRAPGTPWDVRRDPSIRPVLDVRQGESVPLIRYMRETLRYRSDLLYRGPFGEAFHPLPLTESKEGYADDWMALAWDRGAAVSEERNDGEPTLLRRGPELMRQAMQLNPNLDVFNVSGMYDQSCAIREEAAKRAEAEFKPRIRNGCYAGGHMLYTDIGVRRELERDFAPIRAGGEPSAGTRFGSLIRCPRLRWLP
jgi:carboxypeptidase C (cathepsin A)